MGCWPMDVHLQNSCSLHCAHSAHVTVFGYRSMGWVLLSAYLLLMSSLNTLALLVQCRKVTGEP